MEKKQINPIRIIAPEIRLTTKERSIKNLSIEFIFWSNIFFLDKFAFRPCIIFILLLCSAVFTNIPPMMKIMFLILLLTACKTMTLPLVISIDGQVVDLAGKGISNVSGYLCAKLIYTQKKELKEQSFCGVNTSSDALGFIYSDLYVSLEEVAPFWKKENGITVVDYQIYLRVEGDKVVGQFPAGRPQLQELLSNRVNVTFALDCLTFDETSFYGVEYVSNYDGDTITVNIPYVHPLIGESISIRVNGVQAPERQTSDACEAELALIAMAEVAKQLSLAERIDLLEIDRDKYFRILAKVALTMPGGEVVDLTDFLLEHFLGVPYDGQTKPTVDWCSMLEKHRSLE